jgi:hypothetical protein
MELFEDQSSMMSYVADIERLSFVIFITCLNILSTRNDDDSEIVFSEESHTCMGAETRWSESASELYRPSDRRLSAK